MERPTSDKILFINSDILIHLMPSKCGILNLGISHKISSHSCSTLSTILAPSAAPRNMSLRSYRFSRNIFQILSRRILASCVAGWFVAAYLCGFVAPGSVCGGITAVVPQCSSVRPRPVWPRDEGRQSCGGAERWYQASRLIRLQEEIDRRPLLISCCPSPNL